MRPAVRRLVATLVLALCISVVPHSLDAQAPDEGTISEIIRVKAIPGHSFQLEEGMGRHLEVVRELEAEWPYFVFQIVSGEYSGQYYVELPGHSWSDFDEQPEGAEEMQASFRENIAPHVESDVVGFYMFREDLSHMSAPMEGTPQPFADLAHYKVRLGSEAAFESLATRIKEAAAETPGFEEEWFAYTLVNGGEVPMYVFGSGAESFGDFAMPEMNMGQMLQEAVGDFESQDMFQEMSEIIEWVKTEITAFRPDLSYMPGMEMN